MVVAVSELTIWNQPEVVAALQDALGFLTDDLWRFEFVQRASEPEPSFLNFGPPQQSAPRSDIILFSGGLDSLAGAVRTLATTDGRVFLISHQSSSVIASRRTALVAQLAERFPRRVLHVPLTATLMGGFGAKEFTQRSRSFLFTAIAEGVAHLEEASTIRFFENGVMSVNLPLSDQFVGTAASRTTHPRSLMLLQRFLSTGDRQRGIRRKSVHLENEGRDPRISD